MIQRAAATLGTAASTSDLELAKAGVLVASDFPADWSQSTSGQTSDKALDAAAAKVAACKPFLAFGAANKKNPRATSRNFDHLQSNVTNSVSVRTHRSRRSPTCASVIRRSPLRARSTSG